MNENLDPKRREALTGSRGPEAKHSLGGRSGSVNQNSEILSREADLTPVSSEIKLPPSVKTGAVNC